MTALSLVTSLVGTGLVSSLFLQAFKQLLNKVSARYGSLATQILLLVISFVVALGAIAFNLLPQNIVEATLATFASAIAVYEILWKALFQQAIAGRIN